MHETIENVVPGYPMPESHCQHVKHVSNGGEDIPVLKPLFLSCHKNKPHENVVSEPERKGHVPPIPELFDVLGKERLVKVHRRFNPHQVGDCHGEEGVTRKVKV